MDMKGDAREWGGGDGSAYYSDGWIRQESVHGNGKQDMRNIIEIERSRAS